MRMQMQMMAAVASPAAPLLGVLPLRAPQRLQLDAHVARPALPGDARAPPPLALNHAAHPPRHVAAVDGDVVLWDGAQDGAGGVQAGSPDEEANDGGEDEDSGEGDDVGQGAVAHRLVDEVGGGDEREDDDDEGEQVEEEGVEEGGDGLAEAGAGGGGGGHGLVVMRAALLIQSCDG